MATSILTPLQLIAGASLLNNQGLSVSPELAASITAYSSTPLMTAFFEALTAGAPISTLAANSCPAFSNSVPDAYSSLGTQMTTVVLAQASADFGSGDISKFIQAINLVTAYSQSTNIFINSAVNSQTYLANTFTSTNNMISGDITTVNLATSAFGQDLSNLGNLIDLSELGNLGSPLALLQRIIQQTGNIPVVSIYLLAAGVPQEVVLDLANPSISVTDSVQKLMYNAMVEITGTALAEILKVLKITTVGITTMADLLNPVKLFPNSYQSLTVTTPNGQRAIYTNSTGSVNSKLATELPAYVVNSTGFSVNKGLVT